MALLKRELYRQVKGPEVTHADRCMLVFDTDANNLYVEREVAHFDARVGGTIEMETATTLVTLQTAHHGSTSPRFALRSASIPASHSRKSWSAWRSSPSTWGQLSGVSWKELWPVAIIDA